MKVEVAYATEAQQVILTVEVDENSTVEQAIIQSGIRDQFPDIDLTQQKIGIFSKRAKLDSSLREGDRIEIYRPLIADPKDRRRERAERK